MQRLEVSCAVRRIYTSLGAKGLSRSIEFLCASYALFTEGSFKTAPALSTHLFTVTGKVRASSKQCLPSSTKTRYVLVWYTTLDIFQTLRYFTKDLFKFLLGFYYTDFLMSYNNWPLVYVHIAFEVFLYQQLCVCVRISVAFRFCTHGK